jgi:hypothetical protein
MKIEIITKETADKFCQTKKFGIVSEGCIGIWGEGDSIDVAIEDAKSHGLSDLDGCYAMEIQ